MTLVHRVLDAEPVADLAAYLAAGAGGHSSFLLGDFQPYQRHLGIVADTRSAWNANQRPCSGR